jgi:hypothetical protein
MPCTASRRCAGRDLQQTTQTRLVCVIVAYWPHRRERATRRHKRGSELRPFPVIHSALALLSKNPCKIKLKTSKTPQNDRFLSKWEIFATRF